MIRVLLADDHPVMRKGLRALLADVADIEVVGEATSGDEAQALCARLQPDLLLLDLSMPGPSAADTVAYVHRHAPSTAVVILTAYRDDTAVREMASLSVDGYVLKDDEPEMVVEAIARVGRGGTWFSREIMAALVGDAGGATEESGLPILTAREQELLALIRQGWDNKRIATELNLGGQTVRNYVTRLYKKLGVNSRAEAIVRTRDARHVKT